MSEKVLVVDDDLPSAQVLMWSMQAMGHEVRIALDGEQALQVTQEFVPDIVLCDIKLPNLSGYDICKRMQVDARFAHTLFLAQTGYDSRQRKKQSSEAGFHYHLVKPIDINKLFEIVYLDRAQNQKRVGAAS